MDIVKGTVEPSAMVPVVALRVERTGISNNLIAAVSDVLGKGTTVPGSWPSLASMVHQVTRPLATGLKCAGAGSTTSIATNRCGH